MIAIPKMDGKNLKFSLKPVTKKTVKKAMDQMKKKKSAGRDGISQECCLIKKDIIKIPSQELKTVQFFFSSVCLIRSFHLYNYKIIEKTCNNTHL